MSRRRKGWSCADPRTPENTDAYGRCRTCHRARALAHWRTRGVTQRAERQRLAAEKQAREDRAARRIADAAPHTLTARQLYQQEKARRMDAGKPVLKRYEERCAMLPEWAR